MHFMVAALGRDCDDFTLHIYASFAEREYRAISERIKAVQAAAKRKWRKKFGLALWSKVKRRRLIDLGHAALRPATMERSEAYRAHIEWALRQQGINGKLISFRAAANKLKERNVEPPDGGNWTGHQVQKMAHRLCLHHPPGTLRREVARAKVAVVWKQHPDSTAKQVIASLGPNYPLGFTRTWACLRSVGWPQPSAARYAERCGGRWIAGLLHASG